MRCSQRMGAGPGGLLDRPRSGRPRKDSAAVASAILAATTMKRRVSASALAGVCGVSTSTIWRDAAVLGVSFERTRRKTVFLARPAAWDFGPLVGLFVHDQLRIAAVLGDATAYRRLRPWALLEIPAVLVNVKANDGQDQSSLARAMRLFSSLGAKPKLGGRVIDDAAARWGGRLTSGDPELRRNLTLVFSGDAGNATFRSLLCGVSRPAGGASGAAICAPTRDSWVKLLEGEVERRGRTVRGKSELMATLNVAVSSSFPGVPFSWVRPAIAKS